MVAQGFDDFALYPAHARFLALDHGGPRIGIDGEGDQKCLIVSKVKTAGNARGQRIGVEQRILGLIELEALIGVGRFHPFHVSDIVFLARDLDLRTGCVHRLHQHRRNQAQRQRAGEHSQDQPLVAEGCEPDLFDERAFDPFAGKRAGVLGVNQCGNVHGRSLSQEIGAGWLAQLRSRTSSGVVSSGAALRASANRRRALESPTMTMSFANRSGSS